MTASKIAFVLVAMLVGTSACGGDDETFPRGGTNGGAEVGSGQQQPMLIEWRATLVATDADATINGDAVVVQRDGEDTFIATISIREDVPGSLRPWHVRTRNCQSGGDIVGLDSAYTRLGVGADGFSSTSVQVRVGLIPEAPYHVTVSFSDQMVDRIIACGDLILR
jgi:hypothetical protein